MAKLLDKPYPMPNFSDFKGDWNEYDKAQREALDAIPSDELLTFPIADGEALYRIVKLSPLTLQHIPYGDGYCIPYSHIRGLRTEDALKQISWRHLFQAHTGDKMPKILDR